MSAVTAAAAAADVDDEVPVIEDVPNDPIKRDHLPQGDYYSKWSNFAATTEDELAVEDAQEKETADKALGIDKAFNSAAEKKDKTTHLALKEAKKLWDKRRLEEIEMKFELSGLRGVTKTLADPAVDLGGKKVLVLKDCVDCCFELPASLEGMIKVFVDGCVQCTVVLRCKLVTSHVEVSHCEALQLRVCDEELHTTQLDLCQGATVTFGPGLFAPHHRVYSAGCLALTVHAHAPPGSGLPDLVTKNDYIADLAPLVVWTPPAASSSDGSAAADDRSRTAGVVVGAGGTGRKPGAKAAAAAAAAEDPAAAASASGVPGRTATDGQIPEDLRVGDVPCENAGAGAAVEGGAQHNASQASYSDPRSEEQHFLTRLAPGAWRLVTEVAVQVGNRWATKSELDLESQEQAEVTARELQENAHRAAREKAAGNQAFGNAEYAQAAVHYTVAIDLANTSDSQSTQFPQPVSPLLHACFANRAACFLKLGQLDKALADADSCVASAPAGFVKGHFRRGLALHAMGQYADALPSLGKALRLEDPKNKASVKQIEQAITFAERKLQEEMRKRMGR